MIATKFVVLLLIGVLCANVGARKLEGVSEDTKLSISLPKTSTKGVGAALSVISSTSAYKSDYTSSSASAGPNSAYGFGSDYESTSGYVNADGPVAGAATTSDAGGDTTSRAAASPSGAVANGTSTGSANSTGTGVTGSIGGET